jgi:hypothetical protein
MLSAQWQLAGQFGRSLQEALWFPARRKRGHREAAAGGRSCPKRFFSMTLFRDGLLYGENGAQPTGFVAQLPTRRPAGSEGIIWAGPR